MQYQLNASCCAAASLQNALRVFGVRIGQHKLSRIIGVDPDEGADEEDILKALDALGCRINVLDTNRRRDADDWLNDLAYISPLLLCVDNWGHWVNISGGVRDRLWLFDPEPAPWNKAENGNWPVTRKRILKRWRAARSRRREGGLYYGISILSCDSAKAKSCAKSAT